MISVNRVTIVGNIGGGDFHLRTMGSGDAVFNFILATSDKYYDKTSGEKKESVEWHRIAVYGKLAKIAAELSTKGATVYLEGRLRTRRWTDAEGQDKFSTEVVAEILKFIGGKEKVAVEPIAEEALA